MSMLACILSLVRDTTGHEWYASGKLTGAEILIDVGFDDRARAEYRTEDSAILSRTRGDLKYNGEALPARNHLHRTATNAAELGAWCGFGSALLCLVQIPRPKDERRVRRASFERDHVQLPDARTRFAPPAARPEFVALPHATAAPVRASKEDRPPISYAGRPTKSGPAGGRRGEAGSGKDDAPAPPFRRRRAPPLVILASRRRPVWAPGDRAPRHRRHPPDASQNTGAGSDGCLSRHGSEPVPGSLLF